MTCRTVPSINNQVPSTVRVLGQTYRIRPVNLRPYTVYGTVRSPRQVGDTPEDGLSVRSPKGRVLVEDSPVPSRSIVWLKAVEFAGEQLDEEVGVIQHRKMHQVHREYVWYW